MNTILDITYNQQRILHQMGYALDRFIEKQKPALKIRPKQKRNVSKKHILIVEDFPIVLKYFLHIFRDLGHQVSATTSGGEAIRKCSDKFELIFLKVGLTDMGAGDLIQEIRQKQKLYKRSPAPIIASIATTDDGKREDWLGLGANAVFSNEDGVEKNDIDRLLKQWFLMRN